MIIELNNGEKLDVEFYCDFKKITIKITFRGQIACISAEALSQSVRDELKQIGIDFRQEVEDFKFNNWFISFPLEADIKQIFSYITEKIKEVYVKSQEIKSLAESKCDTLRLAIKDFVKSLN